jgi:hypothetical protein
LITYFVIALPLESCCKNDRLISPTKLSSVTILINSQAQTNHPDLRLYAFLICLGFALPAAEAGNQSCQPACSTAELSPEAMSSAAHSKQLTAGPSLDSLGLGQVMAPLPDVQLGATWQEASPIAVAQQQQQAQSSAVKAGVDLTAGTLAGVAQLVVGYPFDTIKVRQERFIYRCSPVPCLRAAFVAMLRHCMLSELPL